MTDEKKKNKTTEVMVKAVLDRTTAGIQTNASEKNFFAVNIKLEVSEDEQKALFDLLKIGRQPVEITIATKQLKLGDKF